MNNEFNNQDMNQVQNNNVDNQYVNNYNNLNNKSDKWKNVLIVVLLIICLFLTALTIYVVVDRKGNISDNKDNVQEENKDNNDSSTSNKILDEYYLKNTDIIDEHILGYRYSAIANSEISYDVFRKNYVVKNIIDSLKLISNVGCGDKNTVNHAKDEYDKNGVKYPDYSGPENIAKDFGLTVDEISKMDKDVWSAGGGQYCIYMYDAKEIKNKYIDIYNDMFNSSFLLHLINKNGSGYFYSFDKNLDKVIVQIHGGTAFGYESVIIDSKLENNLYKVKFVEGYFEPIIGGSEFDGKYVLVIDSEMNNKIANVVDKSKALKENKDKLPNYEVTFEKTSIGYRFKEIKKVN